LIMFALDWNLISLGESAVVLADRGWGIDGVGDDGAITIRLGDDAERFPLEAQLVAGALAAWLDCGLPFVRMSAATCAALLRDPPSERPTMPWLAWLIDVPAVPALSLIGRSGQPDPLRAVLILSTADHVTYFAAGSTCEYFSIANPLEGLRDGLRPETRQFYHAHNLPIRPNDERAIAAVGRLILSAALALFRLEGVEREGLERGASIPGRLPAGTYRLTIPKDAQ
jgi:hypothetical protein